MNSSEQLKKFFLDQIGKGKNFSTNADMARFLNLTPNQIPKFYKFLKGADTQYSAVIDWFEKLGGKLQGLRESTAREVCFIDAKVVAAGQNAGKPDSEDYLAVPLVGEVGAGPGMIDQNELLSWVLVHRNSRSVQRRSNLLAVEIGKNQRSMVPTLHPGDIVLIDRDDWGQNGYQSPGNIFLVREPGQEGGGKIKRVTLSGHGDSSILTFYSDNSEEYEPEPHIVAQDYANDLRAAIVGRVVWAWADLSRK